MPGALWRTRSSRCQRPQVDRNDRRCGWIGFHKDAIRRNAVGDGRCSAGASYSVCRGPTYWQNKSRHGILRPLAAIAVPHDFGTITGFHQQRSFALWSFIAPLTAGEGPSTSSWSPTLTVVTFLIGVDV